MDFDVNAYWSSKLKIESTLDLEAGIEQMDASNVNRNDTATTFNGVTTGSAAPSGAKSLTAGELWMNTNALTGAPDQRVMAYNSSTGDWIGVGVHYAATPPAFTQSGVVWYDTATKTYRAYRKASDDPAGIAGWHSITPGYELWTNLTGATATPGMLVSTDATVGHRQFILPQAVKDGNVVGVVAETVSNTSAGLIATVVGGATVLVNVTTATHTVAVGDGLIANVASDANARSVGSIDNKNPNIVAGEQGYGLPFGCFAQAAEAVSVATVGAQIRARLLGSVGMGRVLRFAQDVVATDASYMADARFDGSWNEIDLEAVEDGGNVLADRGSLKHGPVLGVFVEGYVDWDTNGTFSLVTVRARFSPDGSAVVAQSIMKENVTATEDITLQIETKYVPTAVTSSGDALGNVFAMNLSESASGTTFMVEDAELYCVGYRY